MGKKITTAEFIAMSKSRHGDKFSYEKCDLVSMKSPVTLTCLLHGDFDCHPQAHLRNKGGCLACKTETLRKSFSITVQEFESSMVEKFGDRFKLISYSGMKSSCVIECKIHGEQKLLAQNFLRSDYGCPECGHDKCRTHLRGDANKFIGLAKQVHGETYNYSKVVYVNNRTKVEIICNKHGSFFKAPYKHIEDQGCPKCQRAKPSPRLLSKDEFLQRSVLVHGDKYTYPDLTNLEATKSIAVLCPEHGSFYQNAYSHYNGCGCPKCAEYGFNSAKPASLYFVKGTNRFGEFYKVGITNRVVSSRVLETFGTYELLVCFDSMGEVVAELESRILKNLKGLSTKHKFSGSTECFEFDISDIVFDELPK